MLLGWVLGFPFDSIYTHSLKIMSNYMLMPLKFIFSVLTSTLNTNFPNPTVKLKLQWESDKSPSITKWAPRLITAFSIGGKSIFIGDHNQPWLHFLSSTTFGPPGNLVQGGREPNHWRSPHTSLIQTTLKSHHLPLSLDFSHTSSGPSSLRPCSLSLWTPTSRAKALGNVTFLSSPKDWESSILYEHYIPEIWLIKSNQKKGK